jgi:hypothetical protein
VSKSKKETLSFSQWILVGLNIFLAVVLALLAGKLLRLNTWIVAFATLTAVALLLLFFRRLAKRFEEVP